MTFHRHLLQNATIKQFRWSSESAPTQLRRDLSKASADQTNLTGVSVFLTLLGPKRLELTHELCQLLIRLHCWGILIMRTFNPTSLTFGLRPTLLSNGWRSLPPALKAIGFCNHGFASELWS